MNSQSNLPLYIDDNKKKLEFISSFLNNTRQSLVICCKHREDIRFIGTVLQKQSISASYASHAHHVNKKASIYIANFHIDSIEEHDNIVYFPAQLLTTKQKTKKIKQSTKTKIMQSLNEIKTGMPVVYSEHGICIFDGTITKKIGDQHHEMIKLKYEDGDIYIPIERINMISKHNHTTEGEVRIDKISSHRFSNLQKNAKKQITELAHKIIDIAGKRKTTKAPLYDIQSRMDLLTKLEDDFEHVETEDQVNSIKDIFNDLSSGSPMDRLLFGDVGFGKTEIAIRASFLAVCGKLIHAEHSQVIILCPTSILAGQHFNTFNNRLKQFNINVALLTSNTSAKEKTQMYKDIESGKIDIVIGTTSILSNNINYNNIGMIICDEEQSFGVEQKEKLQLNSPHIHYLCLSATPIPRTLYKAISGIQEMSILSTSPVGRIGINTEIISFELQHMKQIIDREYDRNGKIIIITPKVSYIHDIMRKFSALMPNKNIIEMHRQMPQKQFDTARVNLEKGEYDAVIATNIIGSGIDFENANTIIIHKPQLFGISQIHQMRGRVGRRNQKSYCYLLVEPQVLHNKDIMHKLLKIKNANSLSDGMQLSYHDLESRGG
ncbi:helicase-related protein, partial [Rickettsiales bacterium]|nr:helicase-related protein [Rickettsiales bacterium]